MEIRAGLDPVPDGVSGKQLDVNIVCANFMGPGESGKEYDIQCLTPILAKYITIQILEKGTLQINELNIHLCKYSTVKLI